MVRGDTQQGGRDYANASASGGATLLFLQVKDLLPLRRSLKTTPNKVLYKYEAIFITQNLSTEIVMTKIKHEDIVIEEQEPFKNCVLGRKQYADVLTSIINSYSTGFVLAINNEWGAGKTTFVKMWQQQLKNDGFQTLYFNAWENDFDTNPLVALMSELKTLVGNGNEKFRSLTTKGALLVNKVLPNAIKFLVSKYVGEEAGEFIVGSTEAVTALMEDEIEDFSNKKRGLIDFKKELKGFIESIDTDKPLVFIIDELDRCRPNYAVHLLEQVKHFFSVPGIVFILSIDKEQLGNAVRGVYGSDRIDADEYLRRFVDIEYSLPKPEAERFTSYLYSYFDFESFFHPDSRFSSYYQEGKVFVEMANKITNNSNLNLRQIEKLFTQARIGFRAFGFRQPTVPTVYFFLLYLHMVKPELYNKIATHKLTFQGLIDEIDKIYPINEIEKDRNEYARLLALFVYLYSTTNYRNGGKHVMNKDSSGNFIEHIKSTFVPHDEFVEMINMVHQSDNYRSIGMDYLTNRIELLERIS